MKTTITLSMIFTIALLSADESKNAHRDAADFLNDIQIQDTENTITGDKIIITDEERLLLEKALPVLKKISKSEPIKSKFWSSVSGYRMESPCVISYDKALKLFSSHAVTVVSSSHRSVDFKTLAGEWYSIQENKQDQLMKFLKDRPGIGVSWIAAE